MRNRAVLPVLLISALACAEEPALWTIYVANDNCPDYTWGLTETQTRKAFADVVRGHLDEMTRTDAQPHANRSRYNMAVTQEALCFVEHYPNRKDELIRRIREGRAYVSPYLCNSLWGFQSVESALRTFYPARRLEREWGIAIDVAEHIEEPSLPWGVATLLAGCGIRWLSNPYYAYDSTFRGLKNPPLFIHEGPDGGRVRVIMDPWACNNHSYMQGKRLLKGDGRSWGHHRNARCLRPAGRPGPRDLRGIRQRPELPRGRAGPAWRAGVPIPLLPPRPRERLRRGKGLRLESKRLEPAGVRAGPRAGHIGGAVDRSRSRHRHVPEACGRPGCGGTDPPRAGDIGPKRPAAGGNEECREVRADGPARA